MKRRDFIKNSIITTCGLCALNNCSASAVLFKKQNDLEKKLKILGLWEDEIYKTKEELPQKVYLEACSLCQLKCPVCCDRLHNEENEKKVGFGYLKFKDFKNFIDDNPQIKEIELSNKGEIFLNPELLDIIKYGYEKNVVLNAGVGVNLNTVSNEMAEALVKYKFDNLVISIDGATPEVYKIYRRNGNLNDVIANIKKIQFYQKKYNSEYPHMYYKFIVFGHNEHEIPKAKKLAQELEIPIFFDMNDTPDYSPVKNKKFIERETGLVYPDDDNPERQRVRDHEEDANNLAFCHQLWLEPQINWDGRLLGCCAPYDNDFRGNVFKEGLLKALNNPFFIYSKNMLTQGIEPIEASPCYTCDSYRTLREYNYKLKKPQINKPV